MKESKFLTVTRSKFVQSAAIYTITNVINKALPFLLLPVLTRYLSPGDYGIVSMFGVLVSFVVPFTGLNVHGAISRMYYERETIDFKVYIANSIYILLVSTTLVGVIFVLFSELISGVSSVPTDVLWMVVVVAFSQFVTRIILSLWQVQVRPMLFGVYQISLTFMSMVLSLIFVAVVGLTWKGSLYAQIISGSVFTLIAFIFLIKENWIKNKIDFSYIKHALYFGVPLVPHALSGVMMTMIDRLFITNMVGIESTGIYTVGYQVGMIISLLATSFNQAYVPWLYSKLKENSQEVKLKIVKFTYLYNVAILLFALVLSLIAPLLLSVIVGKQYVDAGSYVSWIAFGYAFNGMYLMVTNYIFYAQKTSLLILVTIVSSVLNIVLNYVFIKSFGAIGAAQATTLIYLVNFLLTWILSAKVYKMPWNIFKHMNRSSD